MTLDIIFLAFNRLEFTKVSFQALLDNTDWTLVRRLIVYDDGSTDGTREYLNEAINMTPVPVELIYLGLGSPVMVMLHYLQHNPAPLFAKIDNDVVVPDGWLSAMLGVLERFPLVELLGMEAGMTEVASRREGFDGVYDEQHCTNIGGVGVMRLSAFERFPPMNADGRHGFTEWQHTYQPRRSWIRPDLAVILLDRLPFEPWLSLSEKYVAKGWQRPWEPWNEWMNWAWQEFAPGQEAEVA